MQRNNYLDLVLAFGSTAIRIPMVHNSPVYAWLAIFQLARFYRIILEIPCMKPLLLSVFGNMHGLANMSLFLVLVNYFSMVCLAAPTRRPSEQRSHALWADLHFVLGYISDLLVRVLDKHLL